MLNFFFLSKIIKEVASSARINGIACFYTRFLCFYVKGGVIVMGGAIIKGVVVMGMFIVKGRVDGRDNCKKMLF